ncbi:MAG TPA: hypothetical protein VM327_08535, partial [Candidatus Thermoplasmatota archaeon]|nr:hypothetical protein [Candidatus Thermoplasmatota archaeon]
ALVSIDGGPSVDVPAGRWSLTTQALDFGRTPSVVRVSDGVHSVSANVTFVRLAPFTLEVQYGHYPGLTDSSTDLWMDPDTVPSAPAYEGKPAPHPAFANVHDVTVVWAAATGAELELAWSDVVDGYSVSKINGAGNPVDSSIPPYWLLEVNGETADFGMTLMPAVPGDHIAWCLNACGA